MTDDVVAELDRYLRSDKTFAAAFVDSPSWAALVPPIQRLAEMVQRARDEIVTLRETIERQKLVLSKGHAQTRDEALEEAAQACVGSGAIVAEARLAASAIRALKEKR